MRKKILEKRLNRLNEKKKNLKQRAMDSQDAAEIRSINSQLEELNDEIEEVQEEITALDEEMRSAQVASDPIASGTQIPANAQMVNSGVVGTYSQTTQVTQTRENVDPFGTLEYRYAFMKHAQTGTPIPEKYNQRDGMPQNTTNLGATIPTTVLNEFINEIRLVYGNLYSKVRKLNIQGAVKVPIAELQATFKWITEDTVAPREDGGKINEYVEFSYNMCEIRVAQTLLSSIVTLDLFEREIVRVMMIAYMKAMDTGIVKGTGNGQMLGILNDPRVIATNNVVTMTAAQINNWTAWRKNFFAKLPLGYRAGEFIFPLATVDTYLETMADANNNPIFRQATGLEVNDGDQRNPNGRFFGRDISLVEPDIIADFDSASSGDVIGIYWQPNEYAINTNMAFGMRRWFDEDRNEWVNKMLTIVDGKVLNPRGIWLIKKA
jgi:HK97 family phage major capsid protein